MAPPPASAFVPPIVTPPRLPGGAAAPTVVPASAFTSGSGAAVTAASGSAGDRKAAAPSRGRSRRKTVASAGRPSSKRPASLSRGGCGTDAGAGGDEKTSTVVRAPANRAPSGKDAPGTEQAPTAAAVADVLSALVALLSPASAPGAAFETAASSAANIPPQPVTLAQMMSPTPGQSPLEAAATMLASTAAASPSGRAATEVPKAATAARPSAPAPSTNKAGPPKEFTMAEMLAPTPGQSPLEAAAALLAAAAQAAPSGKAATEKPSSVKPLLSPPVGESPLDLAAAKLTPAPSQGTKSTNEPSKASVLVPCTGPTAVPTLSEVLDASPARTPLEAAAAQLQLSAEQAPSGKAAVERPPHLRDLLTPAPGESPLELTARRLEAGQVGHAFYAVSPLERTAEAMYTPPVVEAPVKKVTTSAGPPTMEQLLAPPPARTPLEAAATVLQRSAELHPSGKAAMASPAHMQALMNPKPFMESPLEQRAEAMFPAPVVDVPVVKPSGPGPMPTMAQLLAPPAASTPLEAAATVLERSAELHPSGKAAMSSPVRMETLMNPKPSMESPLERRAQAMFPTPVVEEPVRKEAVRSTGPTTIEELLAPPPARTPLEAAASVLQRSAELHPSGKAAMVSPADVNALLHPTPSMESPLERTAEAMFTAPVEDVKKSSVAAGRPSMKQLLVPPPAPTPLEASASVLHREAELAPSGKAAMASPTHMQALMNPKPSLDSPLERVAEAMFVAPVAKEPVVEKTVVPAGPPTMEDLLVPPAARTPLESAASVLQRSAELAPTGKAAMASPAQLEALLNPAPLMDSPLERAAEAMFPAPIEVAPVVEEVAAVTGPPSLEQLLAPPAAWTPLEAAAARLQRSAEAAPTGKAAMATPDYVASLMNPAPSMDSPLERTAEAMFTSSFVQAPAVKQSTAPAPMLSVAELLAPPPARTPLEAAATVLQRSAEFDPSGKAAMTSLADRDMLMHPKPSMESPLERRAEAMYPGPVEEAPVAKKISAPKMRTPLQASAALLERSALLDASGKAAMAPPTNMAELMHPTPSMESPLERTAEAMYTAPVVAPPATKIMMAHKLRTPLQASAAVLERSALLDPSGKAAMAPPTNLAALLHPTPSMESPLERQAEALFPELFSAPVVDESAAEKTAVPFGPLTMEQLLSPPAADTPLEAAAAVLQRSAELHPSGKAAMASPAHMQALMNPKPFMESPLERTAEAMYSAPVVKAPVVVATGPSPVPTLEQLLAPPAASTPLEAAATVLQRSAELHPSGKAAMESPAHMSMLLHPTPSLESPLERTAEAMYTPPVVEAPVKKVTTSAGPPTMEQLLAPPPARTPLEAAATVLQRSAELHPSGKAAMASPAHMQALMNPKPFMESPLEQRAEAMFPAPVVDVPVVKPSGPGPMPTMAQLLAPPAASTPLEAAATVLERSAELHPSGKAAMSSPVRMETLMNPKPSMESPLERRAQAMFPTPVVEEPVRKEAVRSTGPTTIEELLAPPPARTPLEAAASVLQRSAELHPSGKAAMVSPADVNALLHPTPSMESPLERRAEAMFPAPTVKKSKAKVSAPVLRSPLQAAASVLERSAELDPSGKAAMARPTILATLLHAGPSMDSPLEQVAQSLIPPTPAPEVEVRSRIVSELLPSSGPTPMPTLAEFLDTQPARSPLEVSASILERSAILDPSGKAAMAAPPHVSALLHPEPSADSPLERTAEAMFPAPVANAPMTMNGATRVSRSPVNAAASILQRSAELNPPGKAAMMSPMSVKALRHPAPSNDYPLERAAQALNTSTPVAEASSSNGSVLVLSGAPRSPSRAATPALPDFVTAAMTGKSQPSRPPKAPAEEDKDRKEVASPGWRSSVPPAGAAAFVMMVALGIYMAMSQGVAAVIAAVLPNK